MVKPRSSNSRFYWSFCGAVFFALVLSTVSVPELIFDFWPDWIVLIMIYWALMLPERVGAWTGLMVGVLVEVVMVKKFGVYAFGFATLMYLVNRINLQVKMLSVWQQMLVIAVLAGLFKLTTGWMYGLIDDYVIRSESFYSLVGNMFAWPFLFILLQEITHGIRTR